MMNLKSLIILVFLCSFGMGGAAQATISSDFVASNDTTKSKTIKASNAVKIIRNEDEIILRKGTILEVDLGDEEEFSQVRIHSLTWQISKAF